MKRIKRFNESATVNPINSLESEILDILQDSFLDESKLLISLKTHSSDGVTQKDWDVAVELDNLI